MFKSIRAKLITILVILGVLPLSIVSFLAYETASDALLYQAREQLGNIGEKTAQQIDDFFQDLEKDIYLLSEYPFLQLAFLQYEFRQRLDTVQRILIDYDAKNNYFNGIYLIDLNGETIVSDNDYSSAGEADLSAEWFKKALQSGLYLAKTDVSGQGSLPKIILSKTVHDFEDTGKIVGLLVFDIQFEAFTRFVSSLKIGENGYAFLWDHDGYTLYHPDPGELLKSQISRDDNSSFQRLLERMSRGEKGYGSYTLNGIPKNMFFTPCQTFAWSIGIALEKSKLMADILQLRQRMITFISIICGLILLVSYLFVRSIIRPINRLTEGARAIGDGNLEHTITIDSRDEFLRLANEFNGMSSRLRQSMNEIIELKTFNDDILRSVSSGIITVNRQDEITSFNEMAGKILNLDLNDPLASTSPQLGRIQVVLHRTLVNGEPLTSGQLEFYNATDGHFVFLELNTSLLRNSSGQVIGAIADLRDITRRKKIEEEMVRVEKLASLGELSAGMAHEIRNPLAGMKTSAQVLSKRLNAESDMVLLNGIIASIDRMNNTVTDLLNFSRPKQSCPAPCRLPEIIGESMNMLREKLRKSKIELVLDNAEDLPMAMVDREQIQQVVINLALNAMKAMPSGGTLTVSTRARLSSEQNFIELSFIDNGIGIQKEHRGKIFNPFFTTDPKGTGLGLSIVQKLLEKNKGSIQIDSMVKKGTHAVILLPVV
ncbi:MAG: cache domain-containing protein [Desulfopila sp.]